MLVRGSGRDTVLLTGHYDTVSPTDYGDLEPLASEPGGAAPGPAGAAVPQRRTVAAEQRALADFNAGD